MYHAPETPVVFDRDLSIYGQADIFNHLSGIHFNGKYSLHFTCLFLQVFGRVGIQGNGPE